MRIPRTNAFICTLLLLLGIYALCVFIEYWDPTRYGTLRWARTPFNAFIAIGAYILALGLISARWFRSGSPWFISLVLSLLLAATVFASVGWVLAKHFYQASSDPEKSEHDLVAVGCGVIFFLVLACDIATYFMRIFNEWYERHYNTKA